MRKRVVYCGRVQGVGFRATTHDIASRFDVTGYVRNLPDGNVEIVATGSDAQVTAFLDAIEARMSKYIETSQVDTIADGSEDFDGFTIR